MSPPRPDGIEGVDRNRIVEAHASRKHRLDVLREAAGELPEHALFGVSAADRVILEREMVVEARHHFAWDHCELQQAMVQVEEIAVLAALKHPAMLDHRAQLFVAVAGLLDGERRVGADRHLLALAVQVVLEPPGLGAGRQDVEQKAIWPQAIAPFGSAVKTRRWTP